jgi:DNA-binding MarR family transcriptional regulator
MHFDPNLQNRWGLLQGNSGPARAKGGSSASGAAVRERSPGERKEVGRKLRSLMAMSARRSRHFPDELFTDPAWDMLVALALAGEEHRKLSISQLSAATGVPATTAHRWITSLTELGLVIQSQHPVDRNQVDTKLSQSASVSMRDILTAAPF